MEEKIIFDVSDVQAYGTKYFGEKITDDEQVIQSFCDMLGGLPLAISQAFVCIKDNKSNIEEYGKRWKECDKLKTEDLETSIIFTTFIIAL